MILPALLYAFGYLLFSYIVFSWGFAGKKKALARASLFLLFVLAVISSSPLLTLSAGIFTLPQLDTSAEIIQYAV